MRSGVKTPGVRPKSRTELGNRCDDIAQLQKQIERLQAHLRLAVIFGGDKSVPGGVVYQSRNARSWKSYETVAQDIAASLQRIGFHHVQTMPEDMHLGDRLRREGIHLAWLNSGGVQGYNCVAHAPATLEMLGVPYVGHDPLSATTLDNKHAFKREAVCAGLPTAPFCTWHGARGPFRPEVNSRFREAFEDYLGPFIVKPVSGRASLHVNIADDKAALPPVVEEVYRATENVVLIEKYLPGREFCIAVAGPITARRRHLARGRAPFTFAALERVFAPSEKIFTSMDVRPITHDRFKPVDRKETILLESMREIACQVFLEFNLGSLIRIDMRADESGELQILEANPKPDLKQPAEDVTSLIAAGLPQAGMDYDDLILSLFADRLDHLMVHRRETVRHIIDLLETSPCGMGKEEAPSGPSAPRVRSVARKKAGGVNVKLPDVVTLVNELTASARAIDALACALSRSTRDSTTQETDAAMNALAVSARQIDNAVTRVNDLAVEPNVHALCSTLEASGMMGKDHLVPKPLRQARRAMVGLPDRERAMTPETSARASDAGR
jgi:D-alanine-D-alanine ligase